ncbi:expansin-like B1 [Capsicum galapagoense]
MGILVDYNRLVCMILFLPSLCYSNQTIASKATFYETSDGKGGTCGYGNYGNYMNNVRVTAVSSKLYNNGAGCGACYHVTCKEKPVCVSWFNGTCSRVETICSFSGTKLMVTDNREGPVGTDFIIPYTNFGSLAVHPGVAYYVYAKGVVDVNYRRVSCTNNNNGIINLALEVDEHTNYPAYIAFVPITYQGGLTDILAIEIYEEKCNKWIAMRRAYGAVFDMANPPSGPLKLRIQVTDHDGSITKWVQSKKAIIPSYWKPGTIIQTDIQLS